MTTKAIAIAAVTLVAGVPLITTLWLHHKRRDFSKRVSIATKVDAPIPSQDDVRSIPQELRDSPKDWLLSIETASKAIPASRLPKDLSCDELLIKYLRANMTSFTYTPQAPLLRRMCKAPDAKRTFGADCLSKLDFEVGDLVCGVFRVVVKGKRRVEMALDPHESFSGPRESQGRIVARVEGSGESVVFINGTPILVLSWRNKGLITVCRYGHVA
jgi:hypothetical protein